VRKREREQILRKRKLCKFSCNRVSCKREGEKGARVCVRVCVRERGRERERKKRRKGKKRREREREGERDRESTKEFEDQQRQSVLLPGFAQGKAHSEPARGTCAEDNGERGCP